MSEDAKSVLIVDDDPLLVAGAAMRLEAQGYTTRLAGDGQAALDSVAANPPDLVVMDVRMPRLDGISALRRLRLDGPTKEIPVVILSASMQDEDKALDAGASFFVKKPYRGAELIEAASGALYRYEESHAVTPQRGG